MNGSGEKETPLQLGNEYARSKLFNPRKGKQSKRRQFAPFHETHARREIDPVAQNRPGEFRPPTEFGAAFGESRFNPGYRTLGATDMIDEDDLATGFHDPGQFVETTVRLGHDRQDIRGDHRIEMGVWESKARRVHDDEAFDVA